MQGSFTCVAKRGVAEIMSKADGFHQVGIDEKIGLQKWRTLL
jgi:hypothetical protein